MEPSPTDDELVAAAQSGDRAALDTLLRRHLDLIHAVCSRLAGNPADAADATQEALIAIVRGLPRFDRRAAPRTWMYRVATNACLDELRRRGRRPRLGLDDAMAERPDPAPPVDRSVTDRLTLDDALARLPEEFRVAVVLRDVQGMDYARDRGGAADPHRDGALPHRPGPPGPRRRPRREPGPVRPTSK